MSIPGDTELHLQAGAVLKAWPYIEDYTAVLPYERDQAEDQHANVFHGYVGLGAELTYPIRDVSVSNVVVGRALRMLQIELWDAGLVENVVISGMTGANMTDIPLERPLYIDIQHHERTNGALGAVRNVQIRGVSATTRGRCLFTAADGSTIEGLAIDGLQLTIPEIEDPQESVVSSRSSQMSNDSPETRANRARTMRPDFDRGELARDRRKQAALEENPLMHAVVLRNCSSFHGDMPQAQGFKARAVETVGRLQDCVVHSGDGLQRFPEGITGMPGRKGGIA